MASASRHCSGHLRRRLGSPSTTRQANAAAPRAARLRWLAGRVTFAAAAGVVKALIVIIAVPLPATDTEDELSEQVKVLLEGVQVSETGTVNPYSVPSRSGAETVLPVATAMLVAPLPRVNSVSDTLREIGALVEGAKPKLPV